MHEQRDLALFRSLGAFFIVANGCVGTTACSTHKTETTELAPPFVFHLIRKRLCLAASELRVPVFMPTGHAGTPVPGIGWGAVVRHRQSRGGSGVSRPEASKPSPFEICAVRGVATSCAGRCRGNQKSTPHFIASVRCLSLTLLSLCCGSLFDTSTFKCTSQPLDQRRLAASRRLCLVCTLTTLISVLFPFTATTGSTRS